MPVAKKTDNSSESTNKSRQQDVNDSLSGTDDSIERTKQMKATIERLESRPSRRMLQQYLNTNRLLAAFVCNLCQELMRGGVITICGHLYCWTCLWPQLKVQTGKPRCPRCKYELILHEDLISFSGEGPHDEWAGHVDVVAQPDNVERPAGMYLADFTYPEWFSVLPTDKVHRVHRVERNLVLIGSLVYADASGVGTWMRAMKWLQYICAGLMVILFFLLTV